MGRGIGRSPSKKLALLAIPVECRPAGPIASLSECRGSVGVNLHFWSWQAVNPHRKDQLLQSLERKRRSGEVFPLDPNGNRTSAGNELTVPAVGGARIDLRAL